jgi:2-C-methyl-D-erythritol 4-phosphate cytidylyltransferase
MLSAIVVAAGSSRRLGYDKLMAPLAGKCVLWHSLNVFGAMPEIERLIIVTRNERIEEMDALAESAAALKKRVIVPGGEERYLSVWAGLQALEGSVSDFVAIHDGARPLITAAAIRACAELARRDGAACCASPIPDTVKRADSEGVVVESVERSGLWAMQTPQVFSCDLILQAYAAIIARNDMVTDEVSAVQKLGTRVALYRNEDWNFKITYKRDLDMAEQVLRLRSEGLGGGSPR